VVADRQESLDVPWVVVKGQSMHPSCLGPGRAQAHISADVRNKTCLEVKLSVTFMHHLVLQMFRDR